MRSPRDAVRAILPVLALLLNAGAIRAQQNSTHDAVQHALDVWKDVRTVRATFDQTVTNALTGTSAHAQGEYQQRRPDRLSVSFAKPDGDRIVADGTWLWLYLPSSAPNQVIRQAANRSGSPTVDITGEFLDRPFEKYDIADGGPAAVDGRPARIVRLTPKPGGPTDFSKATVWIDDADGYIRQFEVVQPNGVTRRVHLTSLKVNVPVDDAAFRFVVPNGTRVVAR
ncbi:MAG TPA: outer membrane lipoprotein carrier protein LolA [Gemmatimonadaceae bacterium]